MTREFERGRSATTAIRHSVCGRLLILLAATVAIHSGCGPRAETPAQPKPKETPTNPKPWQALLEATTGKEGHEALQARYDDLEKRYAGTIDVSVKGPDADEQLRRFERLMREPITMYTSLKRIRAIAGKPTRECENALFYTFDNGTSVVRWEFYKGGLTRVRRIGPYSGPDRLKQLRPATTIKLPPEMGGDPLH